MGVFTHMKLSVFIFFFGSFTICTRTLQGISLYQRPMNVIKHSAFKGFKGFSFGVLF
jgi:hypothetical protein